MLLQVSAKRYSIILHLKVFDVGHDTTMVAVSLCRHCACMVAFGPSVQAVHSR